MVVAVPAFVSSFKKKMCAIIFGDLPNPKEFDGDELMKLDVLEQALDAGIEAEATQQHLYALKEAIDGEGDLWVALQGSPELGQLLEAGRLTKGQIDKRLKQRDEWLAGERKFLDDGRRALVAFNFAIFVLAASTVGSKILDKGEKTMLLWRWNEALLIAAPLCACFVNLVRVGMASLIALFVIMLVGVLVDVVSIAELFYQGYIGR